MKKDGPDSNIPNKMSEKRAKKVCLRTTERDGRTEAEGRYSAIPDRENGQGGV